MLPERYSDPVYMSRKIRKFRTDKFDTWNKRKFWLMQLMQTAGSQPLTWVAWVKISVCFTYRIHPFETFEFFCSCIRGQCMINTFGVMKLRMLLTSSAHGRHTLEWRYVSDEVLRETDVAFDRHRHTVVPVIDDVTPSCSRLKQRYKVTSLWWKERGWLFLNYYSITQPVSRGVGVLCFDFLVYF